FRRLDPIISSKYSSIPSSFSVSAFGFIIAICSTSPYNILRATTAQSL
uniref:NADH dehydrogenase subunit 5 n=1 Tax=Parascaris equorum TaxID=6256 RepID=A0A914RG90_PAREQ